MTSRNSFFRGFSVIVVIALAYASLFFPFRFEIDRFFWNRLLDAGHVPLFVVLSLVLYYALEGTARNKRIIGTAIVATFVAVSTELVQPLLDRSMSWTDLLNGLLGIALGLIGLVVWSNPRRKVFIVAHSMLTAGIIIFALIPAWRSYRGISYRDSQFPVLGRFEDSRELELWRGNGWGASPPTALSLSREYKKEGLRSLKIIPRGSWPGTHFSAGEMDWSGFNDFIFDVYNPRGERIFIIRIDDDGDTSSYRLRFNREVTLGTGWHEVRVPIIEIEHGPADRKLNISKIRDVLIFLAKRDNEATFYLDNVRLE